MDNESLTIIGEEDELSSSDRISIYKEFIRVLEKDIDDIKNANTREGLTTWAIWGSIIGAAFVLLGQTKDLYEIPADVPIISITLIILIQCLFALFNFFYSDNELIKETRLMSGKDVFKGNHFSALVRSIIHIIAVIYLSSTNIPYWIKLITSVLILLPSSYVVLSFILSQLVETSVGNSPKQQKVNNISGILFQLCMLIPTILLVSQLVFPTGKSLSAAYAIGLCIAAMVILFEVLVSHSRNYGISELQNLKYDLIFNRLSLNAGLQKYQILKEGKSLYDVMKDDFDKLMGHLTRQDDIYNQQEILLRQLSENLIAPGDPENIRLKKNEQQMILSKALDTYQGELIAHANIINEKIPPFYKKLQNAAMAAGDQEKETLIKETLSQQLNNLVEKETGINIKRKQLGEDLIKINKELEEENSKFKDEVENTESQKNLQNKSKK